MVLIDLGTLKAQENQPTGYSGSIYFAADFMANKHPELVSDGFFEYNLNLFYIFGIEAGKYYGKNNFHLSVSRGIGDLFESIEDLGVEPMDNEVELQNSFSVALSYRQQISRVKETNRLVLNIGSRVTTMFYRYTGVKAKRDENSNAFSPTYTFNNFGMNTIGIEGAPYVEIGKHAPGEVGVFLNYELLYFRFNYQGAGVGTQRVSIILKF